MKRDDKIKEYLTGIILELIQLDKTLGFTPDEWEQIKGES